MSNALVEQETDMEFPAVSIQNAGAELNRLHRSINDSLRRTVFEAVRAGEILTNVQDKIGHGNFLPWLKANCSFSDRSARRYIQCYEHNDKLASVANLQEAYQQIETLERQEKQSEEDNARSRVREYQKTGVKPDGWRRGTDDKLLEHAEAREKKAQATIEQLRKDAADRDERYAEHDRVTEKINGHLNAAVARITEQAQKRQSFKERIRVSQSGEKDAFIDAIMDYLDELDDDNRRIEACQNIIKVCRGIATDLQRVDRKTPDPAALDEMETPTEIHA